MSNLRNTTRLPMRSSMTNKSKLHTLINDLPERKTRALEGSLNKLKLTTQRDKAKTTMDVYRRPKGVAQQPREQPAGRKLPTKCGQCETEEAKLKCVECAEMYCTSCYSQFHLRGALQRHHGIFLPMFPKKTVSTEVINRGESEEITDASQDNVQSFQKKFLQWREENLSKLKRTQQKHGVPSPPTFPKLPSIDFHSTKTNSDESFLPNRYRSNNSETMQQPLTKPNIARKNQSKVNVRIRVHHSLSEQTSLVDLQPDNDMIPTAENSDIPLINETPTRYDILVINDEEERPITHASNRSLSQPLSPSEKKEPLILPEQPLRSTLAMKTSDELEAIIGLPLVFSRPSSSQSENVAQRLKSPMDSAVASHEQPLLINLPASNDPVHQDTTDPNQPKFPSINPVGDQPTINSSMTTPRGHSPFSFSNPMYKTSRMNSISSMDAGEGGFFTDFTPRKTIPTPPPPPPPILECSTSNEWKHVFENHTSQSNHILLPKLSIPSLSRPSSKPTVPAQPEIAHRPQTPINNESRPSSSLSSGSLPLSITSSKSDFDPSKSDSSTTPSRKSSSSTVHNTTSVTSTEKNSSSTTKESLSKTSTEPTSTSKDTSSISTTTTTTTATTDSTTSEKETTIINEEKAPSRSDADQSLEESMNSSKAQVLEITTEPDKPVPSEYLTRETNITEKDLPTEKKSHRRTRRQPPTNNEPSQHRKLEFSIGDGLKWQEASLESMSSANTIIPKQPSKNPTPQSLSSSDLTNNKLAEQFHQYDNDDGRSSRDHQNLNDEQCFNQLCDEFCSQLNMQSSDEDALLNEQLLKILQNNRNPFLESKLQ